MASRALRTAPALITALVVTLVVALAGLVGLTSSAQALTCPPGFEDLPGCTGAPNQPDDAAASGTWSTETVAGMQVQLYVPSTAPARPGGRALMVNLHGCAQAATDLKNAGNWTATADAYGMVVAIPSAPDGGVLFGCWDYYDANHSRTSPARHDDNLLGLAEALTARSDLGIDADQVYLTGLSSGGGETMVMGCLAPDVFAGIGIDAGPTVGTTAAQIGSVAVSQAQGKATCEGFAGSSAAGFDTQLTSVVHGADDTTVATGYNTLNAEIMADIYGAGNSSSFDLSQLAGTNTAGTGTLWSDAEGPRVSLITNSGVAHAWPAGAGPGGTYISANSIDYPAYVTDFFFENNRRAAEPTDEPTDDPTEEPSDDPTEEPTDEPTDDPTEPVSCFTTSNAEHEAAGRATSYGVDPYNPFYAIGTQDYLGQGDATITSLQRTGPAAYEVVATCD
ncbi:PHB depolymerase family esterase [Nocardioides sp. JQ2195]|uniref:extracellular catalytic domain type 1 short-chain-length polyhydroxyalkanoate depolymerase n=1 Tax=Nocardioides sp. JQ2195 TaxID=2592334 RepID=UPI00143EEDC7|nr:PHB depolymerase family esterase [Nocardioides sp. JQ2195]QIX26294.1 PHB depolymerase family esterase [Nocardioides sp. JQ2195]